MAFFATNRFAPARVTLRHSCFELSHLVMQYKSFLAMISIATQRKETA